MKVLVTGSSGQLGQSLRATAKSVDTLQMCFADKTDADVTNVASLRKIFEETRPDYCINAAAFTNVDGAEFDADGAKAINTTGARNLAKICSEFETVLIHISTDFVFSGSKQSPYAETDTPDPQSIYGKTKYEGELLIQKFHAKHYIVRTSWLYSLYGKNFMKTMLRLAQGQKVVRVVSDQQGTPTCADDLSQALIKIILSRGQDFGIYHFSNEGQTSWYGFAKKIFDLTGNRVELQPITTSEFPTSARRPDYSVLSKEKIKTTFDIQIAAWEDALAHVISRYN